VRGQWGRQLEGQQSPARWAVCYLFSLRRAVTSMGRHNRLPPISATLLPCFLSHACARWSFTFPDSTARLSPLPTHSLASTLSAQYGRLNAFERALLAGWARREGLDAEAHAALLRAQHEASARPPDRARSAREAIGTRPGGPRSAGVQGGCERLPSPSITMVAATPAYAGASGNGMLHYCALPPSSFALFIPAPSEDRLFQTALHGSSMDTQPEHPVPPPPPPQAFLAPTMAPPAPPLPPMGAPAPSSDHICLWRARATKSEMGPLRESVYGCRRGGGGAGVGGIQCWPNTTHKQISFSHLAAHARKPSHSYYGTSLAHIFPSRRFRVLPPPTSTAPSGQFGTLKMAG